MATNPYYNSYNAKYTDQRLIEDLLVESIKLMGFDAFYLPNNNDEARDLLYGEDPVKKFSTAFPLEMYLSNALNYNGEREFFSKFGLEIRNQVSVILSKRSFAQRIPQNTFTRPREGDLIYIPFANGTGELYEIKFTNQNKDMMMLGRQVPFFYELELEKFKYSQEEITTGIPVIDEAATNSAYNITLNLGNGTGDFTLGEIVFQSNDATLANSYTSAIVQSWDFVSKELIVSNIQGEFRNAVTVRGNNSNTTRTVGNYDVLTPTVKNEQYDNSYINTQANNIISTAEINPFGSI
jgi:hypothetical protein